MKKTLSAMFVGGDRDGMTTELKVAHPILFSILEAATDGGMILTDRNRFRYALVSAGPPLRYELTNPLENFKLGQVTDWSDAKQPMAT